MEQNGITIAIITKNRPYDLTRCLASLHGQTVTAEQLIVVDSSTDERTRLCVAKQRKHWHTCTYIHEPRAGFPIARNRALHAARCKWIVFTDDDCIADQNWIRSLVRTIKSHPNAVAVAGQSRTMHPENLIACATEINEWHWKASGRDGNTIRDLETLDNKNVAYNKGFLHRNHISYDETRVTEYLGASDDCDLGMQISIHGGVAVYDRQMIVYHDDKTGLLPYVLWKYRSTLAHASYEKKWRETRKTMDHKKQHKLDFVYRYCRQKGCTLSRMSVLFLLLGCTFFIIRFAKLRYRICTDRHSNCT